MRESRFSGTEIVHAAKKLDMGVSGTQVAVEEGLCM